MEQQAAFFLSTLYAKSPSITAIMETLEHLVQKYELDKQVLLKHFQQFLKARPDPHFLVSSLNRILPSAPLLKFTDQSAALDRFQEYEQLFHPISITQVHQTPDSFTAVRTFKNYIITASDDGAVKLFSQQNGILILRTIFVCYQPHKRQITNMAVSEKILVVVWGAILAVWDLSHYNEEKYLANTRCFKLSYGVRRKNTEVQILVKDNADQLYIPIIKDKHYVLAQTTTSILFLNVEKQQVFTLFKLGSCEREDKQKITWASYCQATKMVVFIFEIKHKLMLGFADLNTLGLTPLYVFQDKYIAFQSDCSGGSLTFSSIRVNKRAIFNKNEKVSAEVALIEPYGRYFAVSFRNMSCILLYDMPKLYVRNTGHRPDFSFVDLQLEPRVFDMQNIHVPALLRAYYPKYIVPNLIFSADGRILVCQLKLESRQFDKSFLVFFDCVTGMPVNRCILYGTGSGITMANMQIDGQNFIVVTDAENTGKDILNQIYLGPRDTFVYLLREDGGDVKACAHFPNGQEEAYMIFCDISCSDEKCYCTNACGYIMVIGADQLSEDTASREVMPQEQFFLIELPAFYKMRYGFTKIEKKEKENPGKMDFPISKLLNAETLLILKESAKFFKVIVYARTADNKLIDVSTITQAPGLTGFQIIGFRYEILRTLLRTCLLYYKVYEYPMDYFFGFKFLRHTNFHHNSYFYETVVNLCERADAFLLVSCINKVYDFSVNRIENFTKCQQNIHIDFYNCIQAQNNFKDQNEPRSHIIGAAKCKAYGLLSCENFTEFLVDQNSQQYVLHEGVNYRNKDEEDPYYLVYDKDLRLEHLENTNLFPGSEGFKAQFTIPTYYLVKDPDESVDDLKEDESSESAEAALDLVHHDTIDEDDYSDYSEDTRSNSIVVREVSDRSTTESTSSTSSSITEDSDDSAAETAATELTASRRQRAFDKNRTPFDFMRDLNHGYIQSYNSCSTEQFNEGLMSAMVVRSGDVVYLNADLLQRSTEAYKHFFSAQVFATVSQVGYPFKSGLYIVKSVYSRFAPHTQKVYTNKRIPYPTNFVVMQDISLVQYHGGADSFLNSHANEIYDQYFAKAFEKCVIKDEQPQQKKKAASQPTSNAAEQQLFITMMPMCYSYSQPEVHCTAGIFPLGALTRLSTFLSSPPGQVYRHIDYIPVYEYMPEDVVRDFSELIQHDVVKQIDSYTLTYRQPSERRFGDYLQLVNRPEVNFYVYPVDDSRIFPGNYVFSAKNSGLRAIKTDEFIAPQGSFQSELYVQIGKILNNSALKAEVCPMFEVFNREGLENCKQFGPLFGLVAPAVLAVVEMLTKENISSFLSSRDLHQFLSHYYQKIQIKDIPLILTQDEIAAYQNQKREVVLDNAAAVFEQSMSETRRCNCYLLRPDFEPLGELTEEQMKSIREQLYQDDIKALSSLTVEIDGKLYFLTEIYMAAPKCTTLPDTSFALDYDGKITLCKAQSFSHSFLNRTLLYFAFVRALQSSQLAQKSSQHIQNYFVTPVFMEGYVEKIACPVWLNLILQRIISGFYYSYMQLINDVQVLAANSQVFNHGEGEIFVDQAVTLRSDVLDELNKLMAYLFQKDQRLLEECCLIEFDDDDAAAIDSEQSSYSDSVYEEQSSLLEAPPKEKPRYAAKKTPPKKQSKPARKGWEDSFVAEDYSEEYTYTGYSASESSSASDTTEESDTPEEQADSYSSSEYVYSGSVSS